MKKKAAKKKPTPASAAPLKAKFETLKASHAARVQEREATEQANKARKPGEPRISKQYSEQDGEWLSTLTYWDNPAIGILETRSGHCSAFPLEGSALARKYDFFSGRLPSLPPERKREYLKREPTKPETLELDAAGKYYWKQYPLGDLIYTQEQREAMRKQEEIEAERQQKKLTPEDRERLAIASNDGDAILRACRLLKNMQDNDFAGIESAVAEMHGEPEARIQKAICAEVGSILLNHLGDDFALLYDAEVVHRKNAAERLKLAFGAVFDHLARGGKFLPPSDMEKKKFIRGQPRELILIQETCRIVRDKKKLPTKHELKSRFRGSLPASTWTDLFRSAGLDGLPSKAPFGETTGNG